MPGMTGGTGPDTLSQAEGTASAKAILAWGPAEPAAEQRLTELEGTEWRQVQEGWRDGWPGAPGALQAVVITGHWQRDGEPGVT